MDFDDGLGGGFHWIPTKSVPFFFLSLANSCAICLGCKVISRTCQRISMDFDVGFGCGSHWIPSQSIFHSYSSFHVPSVRMQGRFEDLPKDFHRFRCRLCRRIPLDSNGFQRSRFSHFTFPLQIHLSFVRVRGRFGDMPKDFHGFRCLVWRRIPLPSNGFQRNRFPLLHFPCNFICHMLGCKVGSRTCLPKDFHAFRCRVWRRIPKDFNEVGFPFLHFPCKFVCHLVGCRVGSWNCQWIYMDFDIGHGCGFHWAPTESNGVGFPTGHFRSKFMCHPLKLQGERKRGRPTPLEFNLIQ